MKRCLAWSAALVSIVLAASGVFSGPAPAQTRQDDTQRSRGTSRPDAKTPSPKPGASRGPTQTPTMHLWHPTVVPYPVYPYGNYAPGYWYGYPYNYPYRYYYPYYLPPAYLPAETLYGPEAVKRFMGADRMSPPARGAAGDRGEQVAPSDAKPREDRGPKLRGTNRESLARAGRFLGYGDIHFANQRYNDANQRYRQATEIAPGLADAHFRQAYALTAMGRYEAAVKSLKRGLELDPGWPRSDFRNDDLYGDNHAAKRAHIDALAKAAAGAPQDPDLLFLVGVFLYFDGQTDRATPFFQRAEQLAGGPHLGGFLEQLKRKD